MKAHLAIATALSLVTLSPPAWCTEKNVVTTTDATGYGYRFTDDLATGSGLNANDPRITVVRHAGRDLLIRPRTAFISELLKSVENI
jgi:hypothetical protein